MDFTVTRMNIDIAVNQSVQFSDDPNVEPGKSVNWTGRYSARTKDKSVDWVEATSKARPSGERFIRQLRGKEQGDDHSRGVLDLCLWYMWGTAATCNTFNDDKETIDRISTQCVRCLQPRLLASPARRGSSRSVLRR